MIPRRFIFLSMSLFAGAVATPAGIPEPGLTLYGIVRQDLGGAHARITTGTLEVNYTNVLGNTVTVSTTLTNLNDQFSYAVDVPLETFVPGFASDTNALTLTVVPSAYPREPVTVDGTVGIIQPPASNVVSYGQTDRGAFDRMDVDVPLPFQDTDGDGLPDDWEFEHFGNFTIADPNADSDVPPDGFSNLEEFLAGTDPNDSNSILWVEMEPLGNGDFQITWLGAPNRFYTIERSANLLTGYAPTATGIPTASPFNTYVDSPDPGEANYFYRILVE